MKKPEVQKKKPKSEGAIESSRAKDEHQLFENPLIIPPGLSRTAMDFNAHYNVAGKEPILILGSTGVGKSLFLHLSKELFKKANKKKKVMPPIVEANCAHFAGGASDLNMTRSELFGHCKGAFTGAIKDKIGLVEEADGGLLILEEIGELPLEVQAMLLTFIETGEYRPVGKNKTEKANVKIIGATNRESSLRDDFRYRFFPFYVPSLKERRGDVLYYLYEKFPDLTKALTKSEVLILLAYNWPGNVREIGRIAKLLIREKWKEDYFDSKRSYQPDDPHSYNLYHLDKKDTALDPEILEMIGIELPNWGVDLDLIETLLNKKGVGLSGKEEDYAFKELRDKGNVVFCAFIDDDFSIKLCNEYEPFTEAYEGYLAFCGLFLQDPLKDENILTSLRQCDYYHFNLDHLDFPKSKERDIRESAKAIMKYLKEVYIEDYKWPTGIHEFWLALNDIEEKYSGKQLSSEKKANEKSIEKIWSMEETDLRKLYYAGLLERTGGSITLAAKMAGLKTTTFAERLKKLGIQSSRKKN
jgi:DNA-binding NtrC family response regulator